MYQVIIHNMLWTIQARSQGGKGLRNGLSGSFARGNKKYYVVEPASPKTGPPETAFQPRTPHEKDVIRMNATLLHTLSGPGPNARPAFMYGFRKRHGERRFK